MRSGRWNFSGKTGKATTRSFNKTIGHAAIVIALICSFSLEWTQERKGVKEVEAYESIASVFQVANEKNYRTNAFSLQTDDFSVKGTGKGTESMLGEYGLEPYVFLNSVEKNRRKTQEIEEQQIAEAKAEKEAEEAVRRAAEEKEAKRITEEKNKVKVHISEQDKKVLTRIVEAEATDQDIRGKMLVANVVLNRVKEKEFPNTVTDVVFDHRTGVYQFSPIQDGRYWSVDITKSSEEAVKRVLRGEDLSQGALYFMARKYSDPDNVVWFDRRLKRLFAYGEHEFFR